MNQPSIILIPFCGFYNSVHSWELDRAEEQIFEDSNGTSCISDRLLDLFYDVYDYKAAHRKYAEHYADAFSKQFKIKSLKFESLDSPREYNFTTDQIFCTIDSSDIQRLFDETTPMTLMTLVRERHTSRSGFVSFYDNDFRAWGDVFDWDHNQLSTLLMAWMRDNAEDTNCFSYSDGDGWSHYDELELMDHARFNGKYDNWLLIAPQALRLAEIASYLRIRSER